MSDKPTNSQQNLTDSQQNVPDWAVKALTAGIFLITSFFLAITDKVAAGTLTAALFLVCVLLIYLPRMQSFKAWGIEVVWRAVRANADEVSRYQAETQSLRNELKDQIAAGEPKDKLAITFDKVDRAITQWSTANNALQATLTAITPPHK